MMQRVMPAPEMLRPPGYIPPRLADFENGDFPAVGPDQLMTQEVLGLTIAVNDTCTVSLPAGAPFFQNAQATAYTLKLEPVDPSELPPGHKGKVYEWVYEATARSDGTTPFPVLAGQQILVTVDVFVHQGELVGGSTFLGEVELQGATFKKFVVLTSKYVDQA